MIKPLVDIRLLQKCLGVAVDGIYGPKTHAALIPKALFGREANSDKIDMFAYAYMLKRLDNYQVLPPWAIAMRQEMGLRELVGTAHNPRILSMWAKIKLAVRDDETPWCAAAVGDALETAGLVSTRSGLAKSYLKWGRSLTLPVLGCIVVLDRPPKAWSGHVGIVVGRSGNKLAIMGGNQGDALNVKLFNMSRVSADGYRWPTDYPLPTATGLMRLPVYDAATSTKES